MTLVLTIENETSLPNGAPVSVRITDKRNLDIGRGAHLDWTLPDPSRFISGKHCEVRYRDEAYWLYDVSTNGTFLNDNTRRIQTPHRLCDGDRLAIGSYIIAVKIEDDAARPEAEAHGGAEAAAQGAFESPLEESVSEDHLAPAKEQAAPEAVETSAEEHVSQEFVSQELASQELASQELASQEFAAEELSPEEYVSEKRASEKHLGEEPETESQAAGNQVAESQVAESQVTAAEAAETEASSTGASFSHPEPPASPADHAESTAEAEARASTEERPGESEHPAIAEKAPIEEDSAEEVAVEHAAAHSDPAAAHSDEDAPAEALAESLSEPVKPAKPVFAPLSSFIGMPRVSETPAYFGEMKRETAPEPATPSLESAPSLEPASSLEPQRAFTPEPIPTTPAAPATPAIAIPPVAAPPIASPPITSPAVSASAAAPAPVLAPAPTAPAPAAPAPAAPAAELKTPHLPKADAPEIPTSSQAAAKPEVTLDDFLQHFAAAAGIPVQLFDRQDKLKTADDLGFFVHFAVSSLKQLLSARDSAKRFARTSNRTVVQAFDNNPLKFAPTPEDALKIMFGPKTSGYLDARRTLESAFNDLKTHQVKTFSAMQGAVKMLVEDLDPDEIDAAMGQEQGLMALLSSRKARLWDLYLARWQAKTLRHEDGLVDAFMLYFSECYDSAKE